MFKEFKKFLSKGSAVDLAIGMIIGAAFTKIVTSLADDIITPIISLIPSMNFMPYAIELWGSSIRLGAFVTNIVNFLVTGFALFLLVKALNKLNLRKDALEKKPCPFCKQEIAGDASRCPFCTSELTAKNGEANEI